MENLDDDNEVEYIDPESGEKARAFFALVTTKDAAGDFKLAKVRERNTKARPSPHTTQPAARRHGLASLVRHTPTSLFMSVHVAL